MTRKAPVPVPALANARPAPAKKAPAKKAPPAGIDFSADAEGAKAPSKDSLKQLGTLCAQLRTVQFQVADIDGQLKIAEDLQRKIQEEDIPELMRECGLTAVTLEDGSKVELRDDIQCGIAEERREAAHQWLRAQGLGGIIKIAVAVTFGRDENARAERLVEALAKKNYDVEVVERVHPQTLKATLNERREKGVTVPEEPFGLRPYTVAAVKPPAGVAAPPKPRAKKK